MSRVPARRRLTPAAPERLPSHERKEQLLRTAATLLERHGVDGLELTRLASSAGVSRPIVYRFFPSRQALIMGVLEDLEAELKTRFAEAAARPFEGGMEEAAARFIDAVCDAIEAKGVGPWELLGSKGPDPEVARLANEIQARLLAPWMAPVRESTGMTAREATTVTNMFVAAGRAALEEWYRGALGRPEAARAATRGVSALLSAFVKAPGRTRKR